MVIFSNCKINIGLHIVSKRINGFHNLETVFYPIPFYDVVEIIKSKEFQFTTTGLKIDGNPSDNLCVKAFYLLKETYPNLAVENVHIHLHKNIPMGAGLGGGSANAAYTLQLLNTKLDLNIPPIELKFLAAKLGSDCSFFMENKAGLEIENGDGDLYTKVFVPLALDLKNYTIVLVFPNISISTKEAFSNVIPMQPTQSLKELIQQPTENWKENITNDFEKTIFPKYPKLEDIKRQLYNTGALYSSMSGSGSTMYGIFEKQEGLENLIHQSNIKMPFKIF